MPIHRRLAVSVLLGLVIFTLTLAPDRVSATASQPAASQVTAPPAEAAPAAEPPVGASYTDISPDGTCASGFTAFVVARGVRECYTPDPVVENENLQDRCPTDPSLYVCPSQAD